MNNMEPMLLISGSYNLFQEGWNACGIYSISGLAPSSFECPIYNGSSIDIKKRITKEHLPDLYNNDHINKPLQNYFNKNGIENIVVWFRESCEPENLLIVEQKYLDTYGTIEQAKAFNILSFAGNSLGFKHSEETKVKMVLVKKGKKFSDITKKKMAEAHGKIFRSFALVSPDGILYEEKNLSGFCKEHDLNISDVRRLLDGVRNYKQVKGWALPGKPLSTPTYRVKSPDGQIIEFQNQLKFANDFNLRQGHVSELLNGRRKQVKGFTLFSVKT